MVYYFYDLYERWKIPLQKMGLTSPSSILRHVSEHKRTLSYHWFPKTSTHRLSDEMVTEVRFITNAFANHLILGKRENLSFTRLKNEASDEKWRKMKHYLNILTCMPAPLVQRMPSWFGVPRVSWSVLHFTHAASYVAQANWMSAEEVATHADGKPWTSLW